MELKTCASIDAGEYQLVGFSRKVYRGKNKTYIHIEKTNIPEGETRKIEIVYGYWIEKELQRIEQEKKLSELEQPVICRLGILKTNVYKRKFRLCNIVFTTPKE